MKKMLALLLTSCLFLTACGGGKEAPTADGAATEEAQSNAGSECSDR